MLDSLIRNDSARDSKAVDAVGFKLLKRSPCCVLECAYLTYNKICTESYGVFERSFDLGNVLKLVCKLRQRYFLPGELHTVRPVSERYRIFSAAYRFAQRTFCGIDVNVTVLSPFSMTTVPYSSDNDTSAVSETVSVSFCEASVC